MFGNDVNLGRARPEPTRWPKPHLTGKKADGLNFVTGEREVIAFVEDPDGYRIELIQVS